MRPNSPFLLGVFNYVSFSIDIIETSLFSISYFAFGIGIIESCSEICFISSRINWSNFCRNCEIDYWNYESLTQLDVLYKFNGTQAFVRWIDICPLPSFRLDPQQYTSGISYHTSQPSSFMDPFMVSQLERSPPFLSLMYSVYEVFVQDPCFVGCWGDSMGTTTS